MLRVSLAAALWFLVCITLRADEPVTLENVRNPGPNRLDEPVAKDVSLGNAVRFLDSAALSWQKERKCFTCHTNYAYLYARAGLHGRSGKTAIIFYHMPARRSP